MTFPLAVPLLVIVALALAWGRRPRRASHLAVKEYMRRVQSRGGGR